MGTKNLRHACSPCSRFHMDSSLLLLLAAVLLHCTMQCAIHAPNQALTAELSSGGGRVQSMQHVAMTRPEHFTPKSVFCNPRLHKAVGQVGSLIPWDHYCPYAMVFCFPVCPPCVSCEHCLHQTVWFAAVVDEASYVALHKQQWQQRNRAGESVPGTVRELQLAITSRQHCQHTLWRNSFTAECLLSR